jgi:hypothetical protein
MSIEKNEEVYEEFQPWMIGHQVEIGVYEYDSEYPGEAGAGKLVALSGGVLAMYALSEKDNTGHYNYVGSDTKATAQYDREMYGVLISVVESSRPRPV